MDNIVNGKNGSSNERNSYINLNWNVFRKDVHHDNIWKLLRTSN